ncbi:MAG: IPT/TIG domain-containing protein [Candidatus Vogelbacteria bacterium]|nr:IPT/TIG domain-containing protein [Candidatus Vogelbacteria bacterium]
MKQKLIAAAILAAAVVWPPDLLRRLQVLLAQLVKQLQVQMQAQKVQAPIPIPPVVVSVPEILSVTPARGPLGTTITIRGSGFTKTGNTVFASYGTLSDLSSSDGETITLRVEPPGLPPNLGALKTATFPELRYRFYLRNANGATKTPGEFVLDL